MKKLISLGLVVISLVGLSACHHHHHGHHHGPMPPPVYGGFHGHHHGPHR